MVRTKLAALALLLAVPLFAFPLVTATPDPPDQFHVDTHPYPDARGEPEAEYTVAYENLTAQERRLYDAAVTGDEAHVPLSEAPDRFTDRVNAGPRGQGSETLYVNESGEYASLHFHVTDPTPTMAILARFGSLASAIVLAGAGSYVLLHAE